MTGRVKRINRKNESAYFDIYAETRSMMDIQVDGMNDHSERLGMGVKYELVEAK